MLNAHNPLFKIFSPVVHTSMAVVTVNMSPDTDVFLGESTTLKCQYSGVTKASSVIVKWKHRAFGQSEGNTIWTYDGNINTDTCHGSTLPYEKVYTDITKEHAIRLKNASLVDEGTYSCNVEYYSNRGRYFDDEKAIKITVIGLY